MANCPKCAAFVKEEKAFCHHCGSPMNPALAQPHAGGVDFGATMVEPPKRSYAPPMPVATPRIQAETAQAMNPAGGALPSQTLEPPHGRRKSSALAIIGFILLVLFLMLVAFVMGFWLD